MSDEIRGVVERFEHDGAELVTETFASARSGPLTVVIHGIGLGRTAYVAIAGRMLEHGPVMTLDLPGFGDAAEPARTPTMARLADLIAACLRARGHDDAIIIGHSMGTQIAAHLAGRHPDLVHALVLVAPTVDEHARTFRAQLGRLLADVFRERPLTWVRAGREYLRAGPNLRRKVRATMADRPEEVYPQIQVPVLVLRGSHDRLSSADWNSAVMRLLPAASFVEIDGRGHGTMISDAGPVEDAIDELLDDLAAQESG